MSSEPPPPADDRLTPAESRLAALLGALRSEPPPPDARLTRSVMRTARWQFAARGTLLALTELAEVLLGGVATLLGVRGVRRDKSRPGDADGGR